jgi:glycerophosphodiester phosphodiesterase
VLIEFFFSLDRNLEDVDNFYNHKYAECARRLRLLHGRYGRAAQVPDGIDKDEVQDLMGALLELRAQMRKLQWYGEMNRKGFIKITKKLDKKVETARLQERYLTSKVNPKPFAHNLPLNQDMKAVNEWLSGLGDIKTFDDTGSNHSAASLGRVPGRSLHLPSGLLDAVDTAIRGDKVDDLTQQLTKAAASNGLSSSSFQQVLLNFLQRAISCRAKSCMERLLQNIISLDEDNDINKRNCIHRLVINIGRSKGGEKLGADGAFLSSSADLKNFIVPATDPNRQLRPCTTTEEESTQCACSSTCLTSSRTNSGNPCSLVTRTAGYRCIMLPNMAMLSSVRSLSSTCKIGANSMSLGVSTLITGKIPKATLRCTLA